MKKELFSLLIALTTFIYALKVQDFPILKGVYLGQKLPGIVPEVFAPGIVSDTSWWEHCQMAISPDEIYWSAWTNKYPNNDGISTEQIFHSELENGIWTKPVLAEFVKDFLTVNNGSPVFSLDGCKLLFSSWRPGGIGYGVLDLYISFKTTDGRWGYPINMGNNVNTELTERFPVVSPDGNYLFFMRQTKTQDIFWVSTAFFKDLKKESLEKVNTSPEYRVINPKSEELDQYIGVYSCPDHPSKKITISKEGNILYYTTHQEFGDYSVPLVCIETDKFKYQSMTKFEFLPNEKKLKIIIDNKVYVATKE